MTSKTLFYSLIVLWISVSLFWTIIPRKRRTLFLTGLSLAFCSLFGIGFFLYYCVTLLVVYRISFFLRIEFARRHVTMAQIETAVIDNPEYHHFIRAHFDYTNLLSGRNDMFHDPNHLNEAGAAIVSRQLANDLKKHGISFIFHRCFPKRCFPE